LFAFTLHPVYQANEHVLSTCMLTIFGSTMQIFLVTVQSAELSSLLQGTTEPDGIWRTVFAGDIK